MIWSWNLSSSFSSCNWSRSFLRFAFSNCNCSMRCNWFLIKARLLSWLIACAFVLAVGVLHELWALILWRANSCTCLRIGSVLFAVWICSCFCVSVLLTRVLMSSARLLWFVAFDCHAKDCASMGAIFMFELRFGLHFCISGLAQGLNVSGHRTSSVCFALLWMEFNWFELIWIHLFWIWCETATAIVLTFVRMVILCYYYFCYYY